MELTRTLTGDRFFNPPCSPDFNVMEASSYLDRKVRESRVTSIRSLKEVDTTLEWDHLGQFRGNVESMPTRLQQCLDRKGARTDY